MILVLCETDPATGEVDEVSLETLALARALSTEGGGVAVRAVVVGPVADTDAVAATLGGHGATEVRHATGDGVASFGGAAWATALDAVRQETGSVAVLAGGTPRGNEVVAHLAARLAVPMAANVVSFEGLSPLTVRRQVAGGVALEEMRLSNRPALLTVAGHAWQAEETGAGPATWVESTVDVPAEELVARVVRTAERAADESGSLTSAPVVVGAGRGAGGPDGFGPVTELAELLGGAVGVTRVVTSLGWRPHHEQVGQTGSRISPDLYVACGISGAIQHWAGCASSRAILAVNTDPEAPMMTRATYAVVGDMHEVVPAIVEEIRKRG
ncbi:electron transfer flavoprotein subunit alpha/FixB family protein [Nocardioides euryhalodurans]|uniref:Electron transfer flavoprotein subunit alpha/FixB family protein n=1 Tax=Nocardioides euryhalodurans TaxID=2518370 RepID=A0A4P7GJM2_9ACTN|nr:electron transfer flavoprotein subunit alpha/FixB family protein [Nocardioides euryhalodurans]QBR92093.1 electron transfer flavoprotein subunit alpha/FixB family protein [Nocardioides euryhalodurans]